MVSKWYKFLGCLFICLSISSNIQAQIIDTIKYSLHQKPKFFLTLASFVTFIDGQSANINRIKLGLNYNEKVKLGISLSDLGRNDVVTTIHVKEGSNEYDTDARLLYTNVGISAEYFFYDDYPWQFAFSPLNFSVGKAKYQYINRTEHKETSTPSETVVAYQPEVSAQFSIFRWIGLGATTGYRCTLYRSRKATEHLNAPLFAIDVRLFIDEVYKALFVDGEKNN